ncbi:hypothetical protein APHAL10511_005397 [Amanita phalloides]|nr:hypothetical protein APHAL10511_005397 [Amanita phalloides]
MTLSRPATASTAQQTIRVNPDVEILPSPALEKNHHRPSKAKRRWMQLARSFKRPWTIPRALQWIPANFTWDKLKPVIRCAVSAWIAIVLFIIPEVSRFMGQAAFLITIAAIVSPPNEPFVSILERELVLLLFSSIGWAWSCMGIFFAHLARTNKTKATLAAVLTGQFLEAAPTTIIAVWIFLASATLLYLRAKLGPGPYIFPIILALITIDLTMQNAVLFPFPYYLFGRSIMIPLAFHSAINVLCSAIVFPDSVSSLFTKRLQNVLFPLASALELHQTILTTAHDSPEFTSLSSQITSITGKAEDALVPLSASARLLKSDLVYSRFAPYDFKCVQDNLGRLIGRAAGMAMYFTFIDPTRERFSVTPIPSLPTSPVLGSPVLSRQPSSERLGHKGRELGKEEEPASQSIVTRRRGRPTSDRSPSLNHTHVSDPDFHSSHSRPHPRPSHHSHLHHPHSHHLHYRLLHLKKTSRHEHAVGTFEVQKYLNLEAAHLHTPLADAYTRQMLHLMRDSCTELLEACHETIVTTRSWLGGVFNRRFCFWRSAEQKQSEWQKRVHDLKVVRDRLGTELESFRTSKRHLVVDPYRQLFEPVPQAENWEEEMEYGAPPHRYLFHCYVYQYHLMQFGDASLNTLNGIIDLEEKRRSETIWTPAQHLFRLSGSAVADNVEKDVEEDPDRVEGMEDFDDDLTMHPQKRDPDALPPSNFLERISDFIYQAGVAMLNGNLVYAVKAGLLTVLLFLPSFFKSSASFAYRQKFIWAVFMGQLTLARFRGDTAFTFVSRISATFFGGVIGMVIWYIAAGKDNRGNPYGLAAVFVVCFPLIFYAMLYWPVPPLTHIIMFVTAMLVVAYSYQDAHFPSPSSPGVGFAVTWRRFVLVVVGVTIAFIFSFFPPSTTNRAYHRRLLSTTSSELGAIYCQVISYTNSRRQVEKPGIITDLLAIRRKLRKAHAVRQNVRYDVSLRGKWPEKRYLAILETQLQIAFALSHLVSIVGHLDLSWSRAFLRRTRFSDVDFQGDILAVITMISTALRTGQPLPQITPCPLLDKFQLRFHGLEAMHKELHEDYGLPRQLTLDLLKDEQYMTFCVGVSTAFGMMTRLDRLMLAAKEVVGEQYYIRGLGPERHGSVDLGQKPSS